MLWEWEWKQKLNVWLMESWCSVDFVIKFITVVMAPNKQNISIVYRWFKVPCFHRNNAVFLGFRFNKLMFLFASAYYFNFEMTTIRVHTINIQWGRWYLRWMTLEKFERMTQIRMVCQLVSRVNMTMPCYGIQLIKGEMNGIEWNDGGLCITTEYVTHQWVIITIKIVHVHKNHITEIPCNG